MSYKTKLIIALGLVYVVWGSTFLGVKVALNTLTPLLTSGIRFTVAGSLLFLFTLIKDKSLPSLKQTRNAAFLGIMLTGIGNCTMAYAINYIPTGIVALISATIPLWVFIINLLFFDKQRPSNLSTIGLLLGIVGMFYLLNPFSGLKQSIAIFPAFIMLLGTISWAFGSLKSKNLALPSSLQSAAIQMFTGGIFGLIFSFVLEDNQLQALVNSNGATLAAMVYLIFIGSYIGYMSYLWLINNAEPQLAATYAYVNPVVALLLGTVFLNEPLTSQTIIASLIILSGVVLMTLRNKSQT